MSEPLHTPAPWRAFKTPLNPWWHVHMEGGRDVADVQGGSVVVWNDPDHPEAVKANAALIAAAPDLLALAKQYASECAECNGTGRAPTLSASGHPAGDVDCPECADIRALISKAEPGL